MIKNQEQNKGIEKIIEDDNIKAAEINKLDGITFKTRLEAISSQFEGEFTIHDILSKFGLSRYRSFPAHPSHSTLVRRIKHLLIQEMRDGCLKYRTNTDMIVFYSKITR